MSLKKTDEQFKKEVHNLFRDEYTVLDEYLHNKKKIRVRHNKCDYEYDTISTNFLNKHDYLKCRFKKEALKIKKEILD